MASVTFTAVKTASHASNGSIDLVMTTKYSGDLSVTLTLDCLNQLIAMLATNEATARVPLSTASEPGDAQLAAASETPPAQARKVRSPKRISIDADVQMHDSVIVAFDAQSEFSTAYALTPAAAEQVASALVQKAKTILKHAARRKAVPRGSISD